MISGARGVENITEESFAVNQNCCRTLTRRCTRKGAELPLKAFLASGAAAVLGACACIMQVAMACRIAEGGTGRFDQEEIHVYPHGLLQQSQSFPGSRLRVGSHVSCIRYGHHVPGCGAIVATRVYHRYLQYAAAIVTILPAHGEQPSDRAGRTCHSVQTMYKSVTGLWSSEEQQHDTARGTGVVIQEPDAARRRHLPQMAGWQ